MLQTLLIFINLLWARSAPDSFYDKSVNYALFPGRVTDRDDTSSILKIWSESRNVKFFRAGDLVEFSLANGESKDKCSGFVRDVEDNYFIIYAKDLVKCWHNEVAIRRGTLLNMYSPSLSDRIKDAATYRQLLVSRKDDFLRQLNDINNFVFAFEEKKVQVAAEYDRKIIELTKAKQDALDQLLVKKQNAITMQRELGLRLDQLDKDIESYRIENQELHADRWHADKDLALPVSSRPQESKFD